MNEASLFMDAIEPEQWFRPQTVVSNEVVVTRVGGWENGGLGRAIKTKAFLL